MSGHHGHGAVRAAVYDRVSRSQHYRDHLAGLTAHQRHQALLAQLPGGLGQQLATGAAAGAADLSSTVTDEDVLRQHHRCVRSCMLVVCSSSSSMCTLLRRPQGCWPHGSNARLLAPVRLPPACQVPARP